MKALPNASPTETKDAWVLALFAEWMYQALDTKTGREPGRKGFPDGVAVKLVRLAFRFARLASCKVS